MRVSIHSSITEGPVRYANIGKNNIVSRHPHDMIVEDEVKERGSEIGAIEDNNNNISCMEVKENEGEEENNDNNIMMMREMFVIQNVNPTDGDVPLDTCRTKEDDIMIDNFLLSNRRR